MVIPVLLEMQINLKDEHQLLSGESLSTFVLRFTNPDGTPYRFHNVDFSFSLNFIKVS